MIDSCYRKAMKRNLLVAICLAGCSHSHHAKHPTPPPDDDPPETEITPPSPPPAHQAGEPKRFEAAAMCVTHGAMHDQHVEEASMRAVARGSQGDAGTLEFTYEGPTAKVSHLGSGEVREQLGLKLRAEDGCNLVYVMWRFSPKPEVVVQVKRNPGAHTHEECGTNGYERVKPSHHAKVQRAEPGSSHTLSASIEGDELTATVDGRVVWQGTLPPSARDLHGPIGVRTDNVAAQVALSGPSADRDDNDRCKARGAD